ncbi:regulatory protein, luxR family [Geodermatophilus telluris]|uniref:Regulatory protein, luxR family n=1 Tax=Geodermatophilus telluris TaxID=1190417 RepID=A0A1G6UCJ0_9ACTN|nr:LuxR C-terminal-related transcriptional regulator [Geodermatophilus telluris]SDD38416.1 regulatory protein, luxR family [Geodermatophilus telluris]
MTAAGTLGGTLLRGTAVGGSALAAVAGAPAARPAGPHHDLAAEHGARAVVVQGPGGTGKTRLLAELAAAHRRVGRTVLDGRTTDPAQAPDGCVLVVDDAHRMTAELAERVRRALLPPAGRVVLAARPWPRPAALTGLLGELAADRHPVVLGHADRATVAGWAQDHLGSAATPGLADAVRAGTGGLPSLVHDLLAALAPRGGRGGRGPGRAVLPGLPPVPEEVLARLHADLDALDEPTHALLHAVATGAPLDDEVLAELLAVPEPRVADLIAAGRATGYLLAGGQVVPLVRQVVLATTPADVTRRTRRLLLGVLVGRGEEPVGLARALAAERVRDRRAAELLERQADAALTADPALAAELLGAAADCGAPVSGLAARRAQAAALTGDLDGALREADAALADPRAGDRPRAAGVVAAVLTRRGLLVEAAEMYRLAGPDRAGAAALALLATGAREEAAAVLAEHRPRGTTVLPVSEELVAEGVTCSLRSGAEAADGIAAALSTLTRAAALLEPVGRTALLPDTPSALAALVALHCGELAVAESVLQRAVATDLGGVPARPRHLLLLAWIAMLAGRGGRARELVTEAQDAAGGHLEPRDEVYRQALEVGLARRSSDVPGLVRAWVRAREAVVRYPVDLFTLLPLGELVVAAARLRDGDRLRSHLAEAQALLRRLGDPQLWAAPLHWSGAQAAIITDDPGALRPHAAALVAAARTSPYAATLAEAGRTWLRVLTDEVDPPAVLAVAEALAEVGLGWDGSLLAGQAAARARDPRSRAGLLACARTLVGTGTPDGAAEAGHDAGPAAASGALSEREREVARLVVAGRTHREIGLALFISAKTVEHHVSRMRQRLGAGTRSDLLARLRAELGEDA